MRRQTVVDPAVADLLSDMERKQRLSSLPKSKQAKARKEAARHKVGLDLPPSLHEELRQIAAAEKVSISGLVAFFARRGLQEYQAGKINLFPFKRVSRCARFEFVLELDQSAGE